MASGFITSFGGVLVNIDNIEYVQITSDVSTWAVCAYFRSGGCIPLFPDRTSIEAAVVDMDNVSQVIRIAQERAYTPGLG